jgi:hypothetical protein
MNFENLCGQLEELNRPLTVDEKEARDIMEKDHESLLDELRNLIPQVNYRASFATNNSNRYAARHYASFFSDSQVW